MVVQSLKKQKSILRVLLKDAVSYKLPSPKWIYIFGSFNNFS